MTYAHIGEMERQRIQASQTHHTAVAWCKVPPHKSNTWKSNMRLRQLKRRFSDNVQHNSRGRSRGTQHDVRTAQVRQPNRMLRPSCGAP